MDALSAASDKLFLIAAVLIIGTLLYLCPVSGRCPLLSLWGLKARPQVPARPDAAPNPEAAQSPTSKPATELSSPTQPSHGEKTMFLSKTQSQGEVLHVDQENFREVVLDAEVPVLVDFYADWCRPCQLLAPTLHELARETPDARIVKVNVDQSPELAGHFGISSIPTLLVFKDGNLVAKRMGIVDKASLRRMLKG